ncbi:hypothetical protein [Hoeflea poritis]|uniref:Uncharacterized protein n=1 Tax=Hoeflea poritis TaxID=2993659 RepID=A0ABT4VMF2_9HYPH|nr:hypothetical protein [Hoeflea poritis]MDA4845884.1 hypothetical protein [Hoeflea poritis]
MTLPGKDVPHLGHRSPETNPEMSGTVSKAHLDEQMSHQGHSGVHDSMSMKSLPFAVQIILVAVSFLLLLLAGTVTNLFVPIHF